MMVNWSSVCTYESFLYQWFVYRSVFKISRLIPEDIFLCIGAGTMVPICIHTNGLPQYFECSITIKVYLAFSNVLDSCSDVIACKHICDVVGFMTIVTLM